MAIKVVIEKRGSKGVLIRKGVNGESKFKTDYIMAFHHDALWHIM
jgi:hypothetical protein